MQGFFFSITFAPLLRTEGAIAQLVEQRTENPCVPGSIPGGTTPPFISPVLLRKSGLFLFITKTISSRKKNEAGFDGKRSLLRWASKLYSFFCVLLGNFGSNNIIHVAILNNEDLIAICNFANFLIIAIGMNA